MKRAAALLLCVILLTSVLTACGARGEAAGALGLDLSKGEEISSYDTHGGFHGDGASCVAYRFEDDAVLKEIEASSRWSAFPLDDTARALVYGLSNGTSQIGPMLNDEQGEPLVPQIENGYYLLIDRQTDAEGDMLDRYSFNFTLGLYDIDARTLYYCKLDT